MSICHPSSFIRYPRILCLAREFAFGLEPIVQLTAFLLAAFERDFVCAASDFLVTRRVPYRTLSSSFSAGGFNCMELCTAVSRWFR